MLIRGMSGMVLNDRDHEADIERSQPQPASNNVQLIASLGGQDRSLTAAELLTHSSSQKPTRVLRGY